MKAFFQKIIAMLLGLLASLGIVLHAAEPAKPVTVISGGDGYTLDGGKVTFSFDANITTGFSWNVAQNGDSVKQTQERYETDPSSPGEVAVAGRGGTQYYVYEAVKPGKTQLLFTYARPWESEPPASSYTVVLTVNDALEISDVSFVTNQAG